MVNKCVNVYVKVGSKTRIRASIISKFSRGDTPGPPLKWGGAEGKERDEEDGWTPLLNRVVWETRRASKDALK